MDVIRFLLIIKSIAYSYKSKSYPFLAIHVAFREFCSKYQSNSSSCDECFEIMTKMRDFIYHCGGFIGNHPFLIDKFCKAAEPVDLNNSTDNDNAAANNAT